MKCPFCDFLDTQVKDSRPSDDGMVIKRRRHCPSCGARFTTYERMEMRELVVIKKNGERRPFDGDKILRSIIVATRKRNVSKETAEAILSRIIKKLEKFGEGEVETKVIGRLIMEELANVDDVSYVRYASVYQDFADAGDFGEFIASMRKARSAKKSK
jgi:transcriptional repressor NrdR